MGAEITHIKEVFWRYESVEEIMRSIGAYRRVEIIKGKHELWKMEPKGKKQGEVIC